MKESDLQKAIDLAAKSDLQSAIEDKAFEYDFEKQVYRPRPECLSAYYSGGERVVCGILLAFFFEMYGTPNYVNIPDREFENSPVDLVWPGGWHFVDSTNNLYDQGAWEAIRAILPGGK